MLNEDMLRERLSRNGRALFSNEDGGWWIAKGSASRHYEADAWCVLLEDAHMFGCVEEHELCKE